MLDNPPASEAAVEGSALLAACLMILMKGLVFLERRESKSKRTHSDSKQEEKKNVRAIK